MGKYTKKDIMRIVADEDVKFIRMQFTDIFASSRTSPSPPASWRRLSIIRL